jgi:hypothetical protein
VLRSGVCGGPREEPHKGSTCYPMCGRPPVQVHSELYPRLLEEVEAAAAVGAAEAAATESAAALSVDGTGGGVSPS